MSTLALQQEALLSALFELPAGAASDALAAQLTARSQRGLQAYRTNGHLLAERALSAAYPVIAQMVGEESFGDLARALWHAHPPGRGDLAQWGGELPEFMRASNQLMDEPYLGDVAQLEWAMHCCAGAADIPVQPETFALLANEDPQTLQLVLAPGVSVLASRWPVTDIVLAHRDSHPDFAKVGQSIRAQVAQTSVVWRVGLAANLRNALSGEEMLLTRLAAGASFGAALDEASGLDLGTWLPMAVQTGLVLGVQLRA